MSDRLASMHLNYNPFGELEPGDHGRVAVGDFAALAEELRRPGTAVQLIGDCGRGKSTHLHALAHVLPEARYSRVDRGGEPCGGGIYLMDEADHFGWWRRWRYLRHASSVAVATHASMAGFLRLCGYRVVDVHVGRTDPEWVCRVANARIALAFTGEGEPPALEMPHAEQLVRQYGDDMRRIEDALYDWIGGATSRVETA